MKRFFIFRLLTTLIDPIRTLVEWEKHSHLCCEHLPRSIYFKQVTDLTVRCLLTNAKLLSLVFPSILHHVIAQAERNRFQRAMVGCAWHDPFHYQFGPLRSHEYSNVARTLLRWDTSNLTSTHGHLAMIFASADIYYLCVATPDSHAERLYEETKKFLEEHCRSMKKVLLSLFFTRSMDRTRLDSRKLRSPIKVCSLITWNIGPNIKLALITWTISMRRNLLITCLESLQCLFLFAARYLNTHYVKKIRTNDMDNTYTALDCNNDNNDLAPVEIGEVSNRVLLVRVGV